MPARPGGLVTTDDRGAPVLITLAEAARMANRTKGAIRKAVDGGKLTATRDEQGRLRVQAPTWNGCGRTAHPRRL